MAAPVAVLATAATRVPSGDQAGNRNVVPAGAWHDAVAALAVDDRERAVGVDERDPGRGPRRLAEATGRDEDRRRVPRWPAATTASPATSRRRPRRGGPAAGSTTGAGSRA